MLLKLKFIVRLRIVCKSALDHWLKKENIDFTLRLITLSSELATLTCILACSMIKIDVDFPIMTGLPN